MILDDYKRSKVSVAPDGSHQHKWFLAQRGSEFVQVNAGNNRLFEKIEMGYLVCNCGEVRKSVIKDLHDE